MSTKLLEIDLCLSPKIYGTDSQLAEEIRAFCGAIQKRGDLFPALHEAIVGLERLIFAEPLDSKNALLALSEITQEERALLNDAYCRWETEIEYRYAQAIVSGEETGVGNYLLSERFQHLLHREIALLKSPPQRVLFIGSGPFPISAIYFHHFTGKPVDCLDRDEDAVLISRQVIDKLGLGHAIKVFNGMGEGFDIAHYDLVLVALLAKPKRRILRNLRKKGMPGCRVLCRTSYGLRTLVYEPTVETALSGFHAADMQLAEGEQTISTLLLEAGAHKADEIKLRWLEEIDDDSASGILRVMNRVLEKETTIGFPGPLDEVAGRKLISQLGEGLRARRHYVMIAEQGGAIVGQVILTPHHLPNCRHLVELSRGIIDPGFRGAKLALSAFREIVNKCEEIGAEVICLDVRSGTVIAELWKSFGFVPFGKLSDYARVNGRRYEGLYMSQTVASLKQHVERLTEGRRGANGRKSDAAGRGENFPAAYQPRNVRTLAPLRIGDWQMKFHAISAGEDGPGPALIEAAQAAAQRILPRPAVIPPQRYGLGFLIVHAGLDADFVLVCWWGSQNELHLRVLTSPPGQPQHLRERSNLDGSIACVWDLAVIWSEREAWAKYMMCGEQADAQGYLAAALDGKI